MGFESEPLDERVQLKVFIDYPLPATLPSKRVIRKDFIDVRNNDIKPPKMGGGYASEGCVINEFYSGKSKPMAMNLLIMTE